MTVVFVWKLKVKKGSFLNFCKEGKGEFVVNTKYEIFSRKHGIIFL